MNRSDYYREKLRGFNKKLKDDKAERFLITSRIILALIAERLIP
jgi:hypothetical protein